MIRAADRCCAACRRSHGALVASAPFWSVFPGSQKRRSQVMVREVRVGEVPAEQDPDEEARGGWSRPAAQPAFVMSDDQFDQWVFGAPRNSRAGRNKLDSLLTLEVDEVARTCGLSEAQKKKLVLAGRGDIKRFFDKVEEKRKKFDKVKTDQNKIGEIYQELIPLQVTLNSGLFNEDSFYAKTLKKVLSQEEEARYQKVVGRRSSFAIAPRWSSSSPSSTRPSDFATPSGGSSWS